MENTGSTRPLEPCVGTAQSLSPESLQDNALDRYSDVIDDDIPSPVNNSPFLSRISAEGAEGDTPHAQQEDGSQNTPHDQSDASAPEDLPAQLDVVCKGIPAVVLLQPSIVVLCRCFSCLQRANGAQVPAMSPSQFENHAGGKHTPCSLAYPSSNLHCNAPCWPVHPRTSVQARRHAMCHGAPPKAHHISHNPILPEILNLLPLCCHPHRCISQQEVAREPQGGAAIRGDHLAGQVAGCPGSGPWQEARRGPAAAGRQAQRYCWRLVAGKQQQASQAGRRLVAGCSERRCIPGCCRCVWRAAVAAG
jgi:hypothetical protein